MINIFKLEKLPRNQRLRKIASLISAAERRLYLPEQTGDARMVLISTAEYRYFIDVTEFLSRDTLFPQQTRDFFIQATEIFTQVVVSGELHIITVRRALNGVRHLLLAETGKGQADWDFIDSNGSLDPAKRQVFPGMFVYLEDIRAPFNVGAMFRCAESFGCEKIFLSPFTADPHHGRAQRTAMGCVDVIPWERRDFFIAKTAAPQPSSSFVPFSPPNNSSSAFLFSSDFPVFAMETNGIPLSEFPFPQQGLLIAGSEELGVSPAALAAADASLGRVSIPSFGAKGSLNVSVAFGIVMQAWSHTLSYLR